MARPTFRAACPVIWRPGDVRLPDGMINQGEHRYGDHCLAPLVAGTPVVARRRDTIRVLELGEAHAAELGPLLYPAATVVDERLSPDQAYVSAQGSHIGRQPVHIRYGVEPVTSTLPTQFDAHGPWLQVTMFDHGEAPPAGDLEAFAERAGRLSRMNSSSQPCNPFEQP